MPLMRPEHQAQLRQANQVLEKAGLKKPQVEGSLGDKLNAVGLSLDETLTELELIAKSSQNEALRLRALETVLKAHGALKETPAAPPTFTINIINSDKDTSGINPIFLPRQLLKQQGQEPKKEN
jgi:hypothetical protein